MSDRLPILSSSFAGLPVPGYDQGVSSPYTRTANELMRGLSYDLSQDVADAGSRVAQALLAPVRAAKGEYDQVSIYPNGYVSPIDERLISDAADFSGLVSVGSMPIARPRNSLGSGGFAKVSDIESIAKSKGVSLSISETPGRVTVNKIVVPKESRGMGLGTEIMSLIAEYADSVGKPATLTPSTDFGGRSVKALEEFYSRFGFGKNSGRTRDYSFSDSMVRYPK